MHSTAYRPAVDGAAAPLFSNQRMTPPAPVQTISIRRSPLMSAVTQPFIAAFVSIIIWLDTLPFAVVLLLLGVAVVSSPLAGIGFVYAVAGANVVFDRKKPVE